MSDYASRVPAASGISLSLSLSLWLLFRSTQIVRFIPSRSTHSFALLLAYVRMKREQYHTTISMWPYRQPWPQYALVH